MMATFVSSGSLLVRNPDYATAAVAQLEPQPPTQGLFQALALLGQRFLGCALILFGGAMVLTLLLMPLGLPVVLLGVALIAAPCDL
jgi:hypothetical protein